MRVPRRVCALPRGSRISIPPPEMFERTITPDKPATSPLTTFMVDCLRQVSRGVADGASKPEALTLLLRLLSGHFERLDSGAG